jgi:hypothetical protein
MYGINAINDMNAIKLWQIKNGPLCVCKESYGPQ